MQVKTLLHNTLFNSLKNIHKTRLKALISTVASLLNQGKLTLTALGRNMSGESFVKHKIKKLDRLLSNEKLLKDKFYIYKQLSQQVMKHLLEAVIIVDWSGCCHHKRWILQASLVMSGRSIPIYKEIHPVDKLTNYKVEKSFLFKLHDIIPKHIKVIIVTDGGFCSPWFKSVKQLGWDFVGRIRDGVNFSFDNRTWYKSSYFNNKLKNKAEYLGMADLGKTKFLMNVNMFGYKGKYKNCRLLKKKCYKASQPDKERKYKKCHTDAWILVTSLSGGIKISRKIINIYKSRMQIEQNFRDMKNQRWGFGLRESKTEIMDRLEILLLISFMATIILLFIGVVSEHQKFHY